MKYLYFLYYFNFAGMAIAQPAMMDTIDFTQIDEKASSTVQKFKETSELADFLTDGLETDIEKVRSIFTWVTHHINYDFKLLHKIKRKEKKNTPPHKIYKDKDYHIKHAMQQNKAICSGYSLLFDQLCTFAGIRCEYVSGWGKTGEMSRSVGEKHAWNAVMLDSQWYFIDATWSSGYGLGTGKKTKFVRSPNDTYFLIDPQRMAYDHFSNGRLFKFLLPNLTQKEYQNNPLVGPAFFVHQVDSLTYKTAFLTEEESICMTWSFYSQQPISDFYTVQLLGGKWKKIHQTADGFWQKEGSHYQFSKDWEKPGYYQIAFLSNEGLIARYKIRILKTGSKQHK